jgi:hypothetical protein
LKKNTSVHSTLLRKGKIVQPLSIPWDQVSRNESVSAQTSDQLRSSGKHFVGSSWTAQSSSFMLTTAKVLSSLTTRLGYPLDCESLPPIQKPKSPTCLELHCLDCGKYPNILRFDTETPTIATEKS